MSKSEIAGTKGVALKKRVSHGGKKPLVESLTNKGCMVRPKVRMAQEQRIKKF
jgi:hypothetical protein